MEVITLVERIEDTYLLIIIKSIIDIQKTGWLLEV